MNADGRIEVIRCQTLELNAFGQQGSQIIVWEHNPVCDIAADWITNPCGEWNFGMWLDSNGVIVIPAELLVSDTYGDPERASTRWWSEHGYRIEQGGVFR